MENADAVINMRLFLCTRTYLKYMIHKMFYLLNSQTPYRDWKNFVYVFCSFFFCQTCLCKPRSIFHIKQYKNDIKPWNLSTRRMLNFYKKHIKKKRKVSCKTAFKHLSHLTFSFILNILPSKILLLAYRKNIKICFNKTDTFACMRKYCSVCCAYCERGAVAFNDCCGKLGVIGFMQKFTHQLKGQRLW